MPEGDRCQVRVGPAPTQVPSRSGWVPCAGHGRLVARATPARADAYQKRIFAPEILKQRLPDSVEGKGTFLVEAEARPLPMNAYIANAIAILLIVLGFAALLKQKTYLDSATGTVTSVELPLLGKLQTNYPALVFVFLGVFLSFIVFRADVRRDWVLTGYLKLPQAKRVKIDWKQTQVAVMPSDVWSEAVTEDGRYTIHASIPDGIPVEKIFDKINFTNSSVSARFFLKDECNNYHSNREKSELENISGHTWTFKPKEVEVYDSAEAPE